MELSDASLKKDYALTIIVQFMVLASTFLVYKLAAEFLGADGFSGYALSRRTISLMQPALIMGLGVGIPRYIAYGYADPDQRNPDAYFISALFILAPVVCVLCFFFNLFNETFSLIFFGSSDYSYLILPITYMIIGGILYSSCYSYLRGRLLMLRANLLQVINMGIIPPIVFFLFGKSLASVLSVTGIIWITISLVFFLFLPIRLEACDPRKLIPYAKEIFGYSIMRVPGDFALSALLALPAILTAHISGMREGGYVAFGIVVFNMGGYFFAPISTILLPKASHMIARANYEGLKYDLKRMLMLAICLTTLGVVILEIFTAQIIEIYLKKDFSETIMIIRVIAIGIVPYVVYIILRSVIDAGYIKPINAINIVIAVLFFIMGASLILLFDRNYIYIVGIFTMAIWVLGALSLIATFHIFKRNNHCQSS
jgi:O-antigen/teichoic acid export membrane protein